MGWMLVGLLLSVVILGLLLVARLPRMLWELVGAALLFGVAGYAWQGRPELKGSPRNIAETARPFDEDLAKLRDSFGGAYGKAAPWLRMSDGYARRGETRDAANIIVAGLRGDPDDANLWMGLGNALIVHGEGMLSPAADYSYRQAMKLAPKASGAPYFYGLALAQSGQYAAARKVWGDLAARVPKASPLYAELDANLGRLDRILAGQAGTAGQ